MKRPIKILGIAPYEELNHSMQRISEQYTDIESTIYTADLVEGQSLAEKLYSDGYDAIISRGGTAKLIRKVVPLPVIDVSLSIYDILSAIRLAENYTKNFTIVGYPSITEKAHLLCDILGYNITIYTINENISASEVLDSLSEKHYELILCDAITNHIAQLKSLNTILITSGFESIKNAYEDALSIVKHVNQAKLEKDVLEKGILSQNQEMLLFNKSYTIEFSNLTATFTQEIIKNLQTKRHLTGLHQYYSQLQNKFFTLDVRQYTVNHETHYSCFLTGHNVPVTTSRTDIYYQKKSEVADIFSKKLLFTQLIPESVKQTLKNAKEDYHSYLIFGERGTAKKNIAHQIYLDQTKNNNYLITINCKLVTDKLWKFLVNATNGPFVDVHNTIFFENIEQLSLAAITRLLSLIEMTNVLHHNRLLFTYDTTQSDDSAKLNQLVNQLHSAKIYASAIRERKNELNIITTLILNKMNIECNKDIMGFEPKALEAFLAFDWPGNFNQLQDCIKELLINASTHYISEHQVTELLYKERLIQNFSSMKVMNFTTKNILHQPTLFDYTKEIIINVLDQNGGNQTKTAQQLGISRTTLWRYLKDGN
ncbi:transcriptional regulator with PAS, ATPase and Fis domain [Enterococcus sp. PF1-24]|uniref:sigma-54-dependent transcriptional regulator n=1 Tax=unclassified Enterococcus TaxID=2608891 RepID=UPI00247367F7|nr:MULTISPECIES: sigma-54-dependent transcriptional regulator [unclassified Enterococcus]MDH6363677.1 transcriptional regulator with PAS, ATPase and Fis domain [Enterococcus sp. PFB1-1]MDH6400633.1 transcriptional regulator with PAS, ATPase and Fis domain [Enterococcus sp. PF1-24]